MSSIAASPSAPEKWEPKGIVLVAIVLILAMGNFLAILDLTIANVLVPHIAGSLASSPSNGTWVITAYGVAEAITVPLTGWLVERFGPVRVFVVCIIGFGIFSLLCGMATSLGMLIVFRVALGVCGGPLIPISQTLLLKLVPERHANIALTAWALTTILAPVLGPVIGGLIGDNWTWQWAFFFKVPLAFVIAFFAWRILTPHELPTTKAPVDYTGLVLLVVWVGALQTMLGNGQDKDWFNSGIIVTLLIVTLVGFIAFVIWESTDKNPIVNLRIFGNRAFSVSMVVIALAFGALFGAIVLVPIWLQTSMGYTATWSGYNLAYMGIACIVAAPITSVLMARIDHRAIVSIGLVIAAAACLMRVGYNDQMTFWQLMWPQLVLGLAMPPIVIPLMDMSVSSLPPEDTAAGAGQFNFIRTLASALSAAAIVALWNNQISTSGAVLAGELQHTQTLLGAAAASGMGQDKALSLLYLMVQGQSVMLATNRTFLIVGILLLITAAFVWIAPRPPRSGGGMPTMH
ncbi:MAG: DHA2 family efflux MFS transporter permease subunit [Rhizomicrobium sp.]|jgi:DHA2 family multidrug resistance protein